MGLAPNFTTGLGRARQWLNALTAAPSSVYDINDRQQIRLLTIIIVPYMLMTVVFGLLHTRHSSRPVVIIATFTVIFAVEVAILILTRTRHHRMGQWAFVVLGFVNYLVFSIIALEHETLYGLLGLAWLPIFWTSLFSQPRQVAGVGVACLIVVSAGIMINGPKPNLEEWVVAISTTLFFAIGVLLASASRTETAQLIEQQTAALVESESRFRSIFNQTHQLHIFTGLDGRITDVNDETAQLLDGASQPIIGQMVWTLPFWARADRPAQQIQTDVQQAAAGSVLRYEINVQHRDRPPATYDITFCPVYNSAGTADVLVMTGQDITELRHAERERQREAQRYQVLFEEMGDSVLLIDLATQRIIAANPAASRMLQTPRKMLQHMHLWDIMADKDELEALEHSIDRLLHGVVSLPFQRAIRRPNGTQLIAEMTLSVAPDNDGKPVAAQIVCRDLTPRKQAEQQRVQLNVERERSRMLNQFVTDVSHDLRTPLSNIKVSAYLLRRGHQLSMEKHTRQIDVIDEAVGKLSTIVDEHLDAVRASVEQVDEQPLSESVDVNAIVQRISDKIQDKAKQKGVILTVNPAVDLALVKGNALRLETAVRQIVKNALDFTKSGGAITVETVNSRRYVYIIVSDTGVGIDEEKLPRIFDTLYRSDSSRTESRAGLGLTVAHQIITAYSGVIHVESEVGKGSTFTISLPTQSSAITQVHQQIKLPPK